MTEYRNLSTDSSMGGNSPSDYTVSSQKAIKDYIDTVASGKVATTNSGVVVAEQLPTSSNNYQWYRKYANGWVEQGQHHVNCPHNTVQTITLPIPMSDNRYMAAGHGAQIDSNGSFGAPSTISCDPKNTTQILLGQQNTASASMVVGWYVCGLAAS